MINGYMAWRTQFSDTTTIPTGRGPTPPTYFDPAGGKLASQVYRYVRGDEYTSDNQLGRDIHPWHIAGHDSKELAGNKEGAALPTGPPPVGAPPNRSLPGIGDPANNVAAAGNILWAWHITVEELHQKILKLIAAAAAPAKSTATAPANGDKAAPKGLTTIVITFDKPVSINGPKDANPDKANSVMRSRRLAQHLRSRQSRLHLDQG